MEINWLVLGALAVVLVVLVLFLIKKNQKEKKKLVVINRSYEALKDYFIIYKLFIKTYKEIVYYITR